MKKKKKKVDGENDRASYRPKLKAYRQNEG